MIPTPLGWAAFYENSSVFLIQIEVTLSNGVTFTLTSENIKMGSLYIDDQICKPGEVKPGSIISQKCGFTIINDGYMYDHVKFDSAKLMPRFLTSGGASILRGAYRVEEVTVRGREIDIVAYDVLGNDDEANLIGFSTANSTAQQVLARLYSNGESLLSMTTFPNKDYMVGDFTVGDNLPSDITRRELAGYVCEVCGGYIRASTDVSPWQLILGKRLPVYDYTDDLDGGDFTYESSSDVDGGLFSAPIAEDYASVQQDYWSETDMDWHGGECEASFFGNGNHISCTWTSTMSSDATMYIGEPTHLPTRAYRFGVSGLDLETYTVTLTNTTKNLSYVATEEGVVFYSDSENDWYNIKLTLPANTSGSIGFDVILTDNPWAGASALQTIWQQVKAYDGGLFAFWGVTNPTVYPLSKIMAYPNVSERKMITRVVVSGSGFDDVIVGTDDGETVEIANNPLITSQAVAETVAQNVYDVVAGVSYYSFDVTWSADPRFEAGDMVSFPDDRGNIITTFCTGFNYMHGNFSNISCGE